ncbi:ribonuclease III [Pelomyxa schiedti]|nr:ribonuclease III [Pelomyxa schiedti]
MGLPFRQINQYFILIDTSLSVSDEFRRVQVILHYEFRSWTLLGRALTPKSINSHLDQNYQLLEFLGDAVCDLIIVEHLFQCHPNQPPSVLSSLQRKRACNTSLSQACLHWGFDKFIRQNERPSASVCADVFEAIAGAVFVDTNFSYTRTQAVIFPLLFDYIKAPSSDTVVEDPVTELYSTVQQMYPTEIPRPFHFTQISEQEFQCEVIILGKTLGSAVSSKKKIAKKMAANAALTYLHNQQTKPIGE